MTHPIPISVVIPARNEAAGLRTLLPQLVKLLPDAEIIVVDDGSSDDTTGVCAGFKVKRISHPYPKGNGAAIKSGARAARGDVIIFMDADGQHQPEDIPALLEKFEEGYDMVVGARQSGSQAGMHRAVANDVFSRFASWMVMQPIADLTSGFRVVRADKFRQFLVPAAQRVFLPHHHHHEFFPGRVTAWPMCRSIRRAAAVATAISTRCAMACGFC